MGDAISRSFTLGARASSCGTDGDWVEGYEACRSQGVWGNGGIRWFKGRDAGWVREGETGSSEQAGYVVIALTMSVISTIVTRNAYLRVELDF